MNNHIYLIKNTNLVESIVRVIEFVFEYIYKVFDYYSNTFKMYSIIIRILLKTKVFVFMNTNTQG